jgi:hypothetical protein
MKKQVSWELIFKNDCKDGDEDDNKDDAAAEALGFFHSDDEWRKTMQEAATVSCVPSQMRHLFLDLLLYSDVADPSALLDEFAFIMGADFIDPEKRDEVIDAAEFKTIYPFAFTRLLLDLEEKLDVVHKTLDDVKLPTPTIENRRGVGVNNNDDDDNNNEDDNDDDDDDGNNDDEEEVLFILNKLKLDEFTSIFKEEEIEDLETMLLLDEYHLKELGFNPHRRYRSLQPLKETHPCNT